MACAWQGQGMAGYGKGMAWQGRGRDMAWHGMAWEGRGRAGLEIYFIEHPQHSFFMNKLTKLSLNYQISSLSVLLASTR